MMKKMLFVLMAFCFASSLAFAEDVTESGDTTMADTAMSNDTAATMPADTAESAPETMVLKGDVVDNMYADANKDNLAETIKANTKENSLKPECMDSGYSIFADGKLYAFDYDSNAKVADFLKNADSKLQVTVTAKQVGDELSLVSIENQE
ncbi:MAG: hypothetical protein PHT50_07750 [Candidatus Omnitrophica bacterium]|nr:hypothetical protein [Candidatus Omnitrophota bacterium]